MCSMASYTTKASTIFADPETALSMPVAVLTDPVMSNQLPRQPINNVLLDSMPALIKTIINI